MLTHADYFVGTTNSGLPHVVDVLRFAVYNKDRASFVDASLRHNDFGYRVRQYWRAKAESAARRVLLMVPGRALRPNRAQRRALQHRRRKQRLS